MKIYNKLFLFAGFFLTVFQINSCDADRARYGCECEMTRDATTEFIISPSYTSDSYSTYDYSGSLLADAGCHTKMTLEFKWVDPILSNGETRPPISYEFNSLFGYFPTNEGMETISVDNDGIANLWKISISEAIDKSKPEGSSYGISVNWAGPADANEAERKGVRCIINIKYHEYDDAYYLDGC